MLTILVIVLLLSFLGILHGLYMNERNHRVYALRNKFLHSMDHILEKEKKKKKLTKTEEEYCRKVFFFLEKISYQEMYNKFWIPLRVYEVAFEQFMDKSITKRKTRSKLALDKSIK